MGYFFLSLSCAVLVLLWSCEICWFSVYLNRTDSITGISSRSSFVAAGATDSVSVRIRPIRVALSIDDHSLKDLVILINSVVESAKEPADLFFHIVACGKDLTAAMLLKKSIATSISNCLPNINYELVAFMLPSDSGFALQLHHLKKKSNHWNSQSGADMVRFFLPSIFGHTERLLYLDNDIIVSCCIEEIFDTHFEAHQVVGIALDSLNWATVTQFKRHYNASHPLVIHNMRRDQGREIQEKKKSTPIHEREFSKALPRYPNDGVLLIDVRKYNDLRILDTMNEVALANARGEYAVNLGTQQFTVLAMYDRWKELTPRANLRHFPDMARGYLMWFYYNGFLHFAGAHKPRALCQSTIAASAKQHGNVPYLRVMSYNAWALSNYQVSLKCPLERHAYVAECVAHTIVVRSQMQLMRLIQRNLERAKTDTSLLYLRIGTLHGDLSRKKYNEEHSSVYASDTTTSFPEDVDYFETMDRMIFHNASWSIRVFDIKYSRAQLSAFLLTEGGIDVTPSIDVAMDTVAKDRKNGPAKRTIIVKAKHICDAMRPGIPPVQPLPAVPVTPTGSNNGSDGGSNSRGSNSGGSGGGSGAYARLEGDVTRAARGSCINILPDIKAESPPRAHWEVQFIVIDVAPPSLLNAHYNHKIEPIKTSASSSSSSGNNNKNLDSTVGLSSKHTSLGVLLNLDLVFMRPKFILVRIAGVTVQHTHEDSQQAERFLRQSGYITGTFAGAGSGCGSDLAVKHLHRHHRQQPQKQQQQQQQPRSLSHGGDVISFVCVYGVRMNEFEFFENLLT